MGVVYINRPGTTYPTAFKIAGDTPTESEAARIQNYFGVAPAGEVAEEPTGGIADLASGAARGFLGSFADVPQGLTAGLESWLDYDVGSSALAAVTTPITEAGQEGITNLLGQPTGSEWEKAGGAIGSLASFLVPAGGAAKALSAAGKGLKAQSLAATGAASTQGFALGASEQLARIEQAIEQGVPVSQEQMNQAVRSGSAIGLTEGFPVGRIVGRTIELLRGVPAREARTAFDIIKKRLMRVGAAGLEEGGQEVFSEIAQDLTEKGIYNPNLVVGQGAADALIYGGGAGSIMQAVLDVAAGRRVRNQFRAERDAEADIIADSRETTPENFRTNMARRQAESRSGILSLPYYGNEPTEAFGERPKRIGQEERPLLLTEERFLPDGTVIQVPPENQASEFFETQGQSTDRGPSMARTREPSVETPAESGILAIGQERRPLQIPFQPAKLDDIVIPPEEGRMSMFFESQGLAGDRTDNLNIRRTGGVDPVGVIPGGVEGSGELSGSTTLSEMEEAREDVSKEDGWRNKAAKLAGKVVTPPKKTKKSITRTGGVDPVGNIPGAAQDVMPGAPGEVAPGEINLTNEKKSQAGPSGTIPTNIEYRGDFPGLSKAINDRMQALGLDGQVNVSPWSILPERGTPYDATLNEGDASIRGKFVEDPRETGDFGSQIFVSTDIYSPDMSPDGVVKRLIETINHEVIHALRAAGKITPQEWKTLVASARNAKAVDKNGKKKRYTYYQKEAVRDRMLEARLDRDSIEEEAVAEMFRDWAAGRLKLAKPQRSIFQKIMDLLKGIVSSGNVRAVNRAGEVFDRIESGEVGSRERTENDGRVRRDGRYSRGVSTPLEGAPNVRGATGPDPRLVSVAESYARENGIILKRQSEYVEIDEGFSRRLATAYEEMKHDPKDPEVQAAYKDLIRQTKKQYEALEKAGYKFYFFDDSNDPYNGNPWNSMRDIRKNKTMGVYSTAAGYGTLEGFDVSNNPMLEKTGVMWPNGSLNGKMTPVMANDLFRAVHDMFGHGLEGAGFRARGEENAWQAHVRLFTGKAIGAMTSETRGQNSWLNYGPYGESNRTAPLEDTVFADQKTGLMPEWAWTENIARNEKFSRVVDLGKVREDKRISEFHENLQADIAEAANRAREALDVFTQEYPEYLHGYEIGDRLRSNKTGDIQRITDLFARPIYRATDTEGTKANKFNKWLSRRNNHFRSVNFEGEPESFDYDGAAYEIMARVEGTNSDGEFSSDMIVQLAPKFMTKMTGPRLEKFSRTISMEDAFKRTASAQRGAPEFAMLDVQSAMGGGVLSPVVEHVGDITHRMTEFPGMNYNHLEFVEPKVRRGLRYLSNPYGFEREMNENIRNNAKRLGQTEKEFRDRLTKALDRYAAEHRKVPVWNDLQFAAREAAVAIGEQRWRDAIAELGVLQRAISDGSYAERANSFFPNYEEKFSRGLRVWHGSDKNFDRFDRAFRKTGEGANAYGQGHYTAEARELGEWYRNKIVRKNRGRDRGTLYELEIDAAPDEFVDYDLPFAMQPKLMEFMGWTPDVYAEWERLNAEQDDILLEVLSQNPDADTGKLEDQIAEIEKQIRKIRKGRVDPIDFPTPETMRNLEPALEEAGFKGFKYYDAKSRALQKGTRNYVVFKDEDIKIINKYLRTPAVPIEAIQKQDFEVVYGKSRKLINSVLGKVFDPDKAEEISNEFVVRFQDKMLPVGEIMDWMRKEGATVTDALDAYRNAEIMHGRQGALIRESQDELMRPALRALDSLEISDDDMDRLRAATGYIAVMERKREVNRSLRQRITGFKPQLKMIVADAYLYALHAQERNAKILKSSKGKNAKGSGMSDVEAQRILDWVKTLDLAAQSSLEQFREGMREIIRDTNTKRVQYGLITKDIVEQVEDEDGNLVYDDRQYENYIPLRGKDLGDGTPDDMNRGDRAAPTGGVRGREDPQAHGRDGYAFFSPTAAALVQNQRTIMRGERTKVLQSMANFIRQEGGLRGGKTLNSLGIEMEVLDRAGVRAMGFGKEGESKYQVDQGFADRPDIVPFKENGKQKYLRIDSPRVARALKGGINPGASSQIIQAMGKFNRYLASINTSWNIEFVMSNAMRDIETALVNASQYDVENVRKNILKNVPVAARTAKQYFREKGARSNDAPDYNIPLAEATDGQRLARLQEFINSGGKNMANQMEDNITQEQEIVKVIEEVGDFESQGKDPRRWFVGQGKSLLNIVENLNETAENMTRFSFYNSLREAGVTAPKAAQAARNLTTNFSKGGEYKTMMNAFYLFYNASLQGSWAMLDAVTRSKKAQKVWAGSMMAGLLLDQLNAFLSDDDEDKKVYDKIGQYELEHNLILMDPTGFSDRGYVKIPLAYGLNMAVNFGRSLSRFMRGEYTPGEFTDTVFGTVLETINPLGDTHTLLNAIAPTVADPFIEIASNKDFQLKPIYKEPFPGDPGTANSHLYWNSTSPTIKKVAQSVNELFGGTSVISSGWLTDWNPDKVEYWIDYFTGAVGKTALRAAEAPFTVILPLMQGDFENEFVRHTPLARRILGAVSDREDLGSFIEKFERVRRGRKELMEAIEAGDMDRARAAREDFAPELRIYGVINNLNSARKKLMQQKELILSRDNLSDERKQILVKNIEERIRELVNRGNMLMKDL